MSKRKRGISWEEYYFKQSEAIPKLCRITNCVEIPHRFQYRVLKFIQPLSPYRHNPTTRVWEVEADSCLYAVKLVHIPLRAVEIASHLLNSSSPTRMMMQMRNGNALIGFT